MVDINIVTIFHPPAGHLLLAAALPVRVMMASFLHMPLCAAANAQPGIPANNTQSCSNDVIESSNKVIDTITSTCKTKPPSTRSFTKQARNTEWQASSPPRSANTSRRVPLSLHEICGGQDASEVDRGRGPAGAGLAAAALQTRQLVREQRRYGRGGVPLCAVQRLHGGFAH